MNGILIFFIVMGALATVAVLARGIFVMASGKDMTGRRSNQLMWYRVLFQGLTVAFVVLFLLIGRQ
ncbi:MAG: hypothetical protein C0521_16550 [Xanthomonas sp.]|nr:hypothetical protein [Xanthomonas sp.]